MHENQSLRDAFQTVSLLEKRFVDLGGKPLEDWRNLDLKELGAYLREREALSRVPCHHLLSDLICDNIQMPEVAPDQLYFLACRCRCALDTLGILAVPKTELGKSFVIQEPPHDWSQEDLLEWLLISTWDQRHDVWMKLTVFGLVTGNTFYSG